MLRAVFPISMENSKFYSQVPFYVAERPVDGKSMAKKHPPGYDMPMLMEIRQKQMTDLKFLHKSGSM